MTLTTDTPRRPRARTKRPSTSLKAELLAPQLVVCTIRPRGSNRSFRGWVAPSQSDPAHPGYLTSAALNCCPCQGHGFNGTCTHVEAARRRDTSHRRCRQCGAPLEPVLEDNALCATCAGL